MPDKSTRMSFVGTVAWMAPELIRHEPCSEKVDVWSYGVLLWELLTHEKPYNVSEQTPTTIHIMLNKLSKVYIPAVVKLPILCQLAFHTEDNTYCSQI